MVRPGADFPRNSLHCSGARTRRAERSIRRMAQPRLTAFFPRAKPGPAPGKSIARHRRAGPGLPLASPRTPPRKDAAAPRPPARKRSRPDPDPEPGEGVRGSARKRLVLPEPRAPVRAAFCRGDGVHAGRRWDPGRGLGSLVASGAGSQR